MATPRPLSASSGTLRLCGSPSPASSTAMRTTSAVRSTEARKGDRPWMTALVASSETISSPSPTRSLSPHEVSASRTNRRAAATASGTATNTPERVAAPASLPEGSREL